MVPICDKRQNSNLQFTEFVTTVKSTNLILLVQESHMIKKSRN